MPIDPLKPTFTFFKMFGCGACTQFDETIFNELVNDPEVRKAVNIDQVTFGRDEKGVIHDPKEYYPDFDLQYAPYLWKSEAYDEDTGYHLDPKTMKDRSLNLRLNGTEFKYQRNTTVADVKKWLINGNKVREVKGSKGVGGLFKFKTSQRH